MRLASGYRACAVRLGLALALLSFPGFHPARAETVLSYDQIFGNEGRGVAPTRLRWTRNGDLSFLLKGDDGTDLWVLRKGADSAEILAEILHPEEFGVARRGVAWESF